MQILYCSSNFMINPSWMRREFARKPLPLDATKQFLLSAPSEEESDSTKAVGNKCLSCAHEDAGARLK